MPVQNETIKLWESVEVNRSASDAKSKDINNLRINNDVLNRYLKPKADTPYSLEYSYYLLGDVTGKTVLDYGCGAGENSVLVASHGADVVGVDISPDLLEIAGMRMEEHNFPVKSEFQVGSAHDLPLADESVDVVFGMAILHHLDLDLASKEVFRVLKKGGRAIFQEPVRNSKVVGFIRNLIPYTQPDVSPYERPLTDIELRKFAEPFSTYKSRSFNLPYVNLVEILASESAIHHSLIKIDGKILTKLPFLNYYSTIQVVEMVK
jgi:SAM-dependent methyltransferase